MADRSPVDTARLRDPLRPLTAADRTALLDEIDSLRAKLAESEAACAVLAQFIREEETHSLSCGSAAISGRCDCQFRTDNEERSAAIANLPASVRAHMEEDAALRELERAARKQMELFEEAVRSAKMDSPDPLEHYERIYKPALAHLDAVRAKGGG